MMRSFMYLRPGNLAKDFIIEQRSTSLSQIGRPKTAYPYLICVDSTFLV